MASPQDESLRIEQWLADIRGGGDAFERLIAFYSPILMEEARRSLSPKVRAVVGESGVVNQTCLRVWRRFRTFQGQTRAEFEAWIREILRNIIRDEEDKARAQKRDWIREQPAAPGNESGRPDAAPVDRGPSPSGELIEGEQMERFLEILDELPDRQRIALVLWHFNRLSDADVGRALGCSANAVGLLRTRALASAIEKLGGTHDR